MLAHGIPRALDSHRSPEGALYRAFCAPYVTRFGGTIPPVARAHLKLAGTLYVRIAEIERERAAALKRRRMRIVRRFDRQLAGMGRDLDHYMQRLDEMVTQHAPHDWTDLLRGRDAK